MAIHGRSTYGDKNGHPGFDSGAHYDEELDINNPIYTEIFLEAQASTRNWGQFITNWKSITRGSMNMIRVRQKENPLIKILSHFGEEGTPTIKISAADDLASFGKQRALTMPRNMLSNVVLPEGSSGNRMPMSNRGKVWKQNGVVPVGIWDKYTEEEQLFQSFTDIEEQQMMFGEMLGMFIDSHYRDMLYYTAGFRYDFTKLKKGYNTLMSPVLDKLLRKVTSDMKAYGAKNMRAITSASLGYGTIPVNAEMILNIPPEAEFMIRENPEFKGTEMYDNKTISPDEIGIIGSVRVLKKEGMPLRECGDGRLIADCYIVANDPLVGLRLDGHSGVELKHIRPNKDDKNDILNRVGVIGAKSWVGAINVNPERTAVISLYLNNLDVEDIVDLYEKCNEPCLPDCKQDLYVPEDKPAAPMACEKALPLTEAELEALKAELAEYKAKEADEDAVDPDGDPATVEFFTYPESLSTPTGELSTKKENLDQIKLLQDTYGDQIITRKKFIELYPDAVIADYEKTE